MRREMDFISYLDYQGENDGNQWKLKKKFAFLYYRLTKISFTSYL